MLMVKQQFIGLWVCRRQFRYSVGGCHRVNVYMSNWRESKPKVIDARCRRCGRRVQFQPHRVDNRGAYRSTSITWLDMDLVEAFRERDEAQWNYRKRFNMEMNGELLPQTFGFGEEE